MNNKRATTVPADKIQEYMSKFPRVTELIVEPSDGAKKRFRAIYFLDGVMKSTTFGSRYGTTFIDGASAQTRYSFHARARKIKNKRGQYTYEILGTPNSFSFWLLW